MQHVLSLLVLLSVSLSHAGEFGSRGKNGEAGRDGYSGSSGQDVTILAHEMTQPLFYDLSGRNGDHGYPGSDGQDAYFCSHSLREENLYGADAGDGGAGGDGGSGGSGGDALIYYTDSAQLKNISIISRGGYGGQGSYGGRGGSRGCYCDQYSWTVPVCRIEKDKDGREHKICDRVNTYTCQNGRSGQIGASGSPGSNGSRGSATLVKSSTPLLPQSGSGRLNIQEFQTQNPVQFTLTENIFARRGGLLSLLAPGSDMSDSYSEFVRRAEENVQFVWAATRSPAPYKGTLSAYISGGQVSLSASSNDILMTEKSVQNGVHTLTVKEAYNVSEFSVINFKRENYGTKTQIRVQSTVPRPDLVSDSYHVTVTQVRLLLPDKVMYSGSVPASLITTSGAESVVRIGQVKFEDSSKIWSKKLKISFSMNRQVKGASSSIQKSANYNQDKL